MQRLVLAAVWMGAAAATAALWWALAAWTPSQPRGLQSDTSGRTVAGPRPEVPAAGTVARGVTWTLVKQLSAHHVLVLEVETEAPQQALAIARQLMEPLKARYSEALIYFFRPGPPDRLAARRVQWTPRGGYIEMVFE